MAKKDSNATNEMIAGVLVEVANLLESQDANPYRIRAYQNAANTVRSMADSLAELYHEGGEERLQQLPTIGEGLSGLISQFIETGRSDLLARLRGEVSPRDLFADVPGIGETLADRVVEELKIDSLEELEQAVHDGRLAQVDGFGEKRLNTVRIALAGLLSRAVQRRASSGPAETARGDRPSGEGQPAVATLLEIDAKYREKAAAGELRMIAPKRFNPEGEAWLPMMNTQRDGWDFTVLFSNTARAHDLGMTHDWVMMYFKRADQQEDQVTVVTETGGPLEGKRVVRGREADCRAYYQVE